MDLHTARMDDARLFYEALLGWTFRNRFTIAAVPDRVELSTIHDGPPDPPVTTVMALSNDEPVADLVERSDSYDELALLSIWYPYVYVDDLERTLDLVEPSGGLVVSPPARREDDAIVATILDPNDAMLSLWQPVGSPSLQLLRRPGSFSWLELETPDLDHAKKFYGELFGWDAGEVSDDEDELGQGYTVFTRRGEPVAGAVESPMSGIPASWCPSFWVADVDRSAAVSTRNGGVLLAEPVDIPVGRQAVIVDPTGAAFSILGPKSTGPRPL